jgi:hypothetical protein
MNPPESLCQPQSRVRGGSAVGARLCLVALLAGIFFSLMAISVRAAASDVELLPNWSQGQTLHYRITQIRRATVGDEPPWEQRARGDVRIDVLEAGANGYLVAWTAGELTRDDAPAARETVESTVGSKARVLLRIEQRGTVEGAENWKEIQADPKGRAACEEAGIFFMALGRRYRLGRSLSFAGKLPDPIGGDETLPCHGRWLLKRVGRDGIAVVDWTQSVSTEGMRESIESEAKMLAARFGKSTPRFRFRNLTIEDHAQFNVDVSSGWPQSLIHTRTVHSMTSSREEKREAVLQFTPLAK